MNLKKCLLTENACYKARNKIKPIGIMLHSTGANNPNLCRYVQPDDGYLGKNQHKNHWNQPYPDGRSVCPHAFIGRLKDGSIATYQTLPWDYRGWHCGSGHKGTGNDKYIGIEICEDGLTDANYFNLVYEEIAQVAAYLCEIYKLNPLDSKVIICHCEGHDMGIASNHADVMHWFKKHNRTMADFRKYVDYLMATKKEEEFVNYKLYTVKSGDSWWGIAQSQLGDGNKYKELQKFNGGAFSLHPGDKVKIPVKGNDNTSSNSKTAWEKACAKGIFDGTNPNGNVTREMLAKVLDNLNLI